MNPTLANFSLIFSFACSRYGHDGEEDSELACGLAATAHAWDGQRSQIACIHAACLINRGRLDDAEAAIRVTAEATRCLRA